MGKLTQKNLHKLLARQLIKSGMELEKAPNDACWDQMISMINSSYGEADKERYLLERSLQISSVEMKELNLKVQKRAEEWIKEISNTYPDMLLFMSKNGEIIDLVPQSGFEPIVVNHLKEDKIYHINDLFLSDLVIMLFSNIENLISTQQEQTFEFTQGERVFEIRLISKESNNDENLFCLIRDISDLAHSNKKLQYQALHDSLTNLPNRLYFYDELNSILKNKNYNNQMGALLFFDLDRFKTVNDSLGHRIGDKLIIAVAQRINDQLNENEFFARMSGDEFIIIISDLESESEINKCSYRVLECFNEPFQINDHLIEIKPSIGASIFPSQSRDPDVLTQYADTAMYSAKEKGGNQLVIFSEKQKAIVSRNFKIEQSLRRGIDRDEFYLVYQPIINLKNNKVIAYESLLRWKSLSNNQISPTVFIPIAEATGFIDDLGHWIIKSVIKQINIWKKTNFQFNSVSINLSRVQLIDPNISSFIIEQMKKYNIKPSEINIEITENTIISNSETALNNLNNLNNLGIDIAIDDFGTGYSSFIDLTNLPFSWLKIDKSIIDGIGNDNSGNAIVRAIVAIAKEMKLNIVAEGVETLEQRDFLMENKCHNLQGFLFSEPLMVSEVEPPQINYFPAHCKKST